MPRGIKNDGTPRKPRVPKNKSLDERITETKSMVELLKTQLFDAETYLEGLKKEKKYAELDKLNKIMEDNNVSSDEIIKLIQAK